jgi:hypothetical protein
MDKFGNKLTVTQENIIDVPINIIAQTVSKEIQPQVDTIDDKINYLMENLNEASQAFTADNNNAFITTLGDLADSVEKTRIEVNNVQKAFNSDYLPPKDQLILNGYDVLLDVKPTYKIDNENTNNHTQFSSISNIFPAGTSTISNTKAYGVTIIESDIPSALNLEGIDSQLLSAIRISKTAEKFQDLSITIGNVNKIELPLKLSEVNVLNFVASTNVIDVVNFLDNSSAITFNKEINLNFYPVNPQLINNSYYYFSSPDVNDKIWLMYHEINTVNTNDTKVSSLQSSNNTGLYLFANGYAIRLTLDTNNFRLNPQQLVQNRNETYIFTDGTIKYFVKASNSVAYGDNTIATFVKQPSASVLNTAVIDRNNGIIYEVDSLSRINYAPITDSNKSAMTKVYRMSLSGLQRLGYISSSYIFTPLLSTEYVYDSNTLSVTYGKLIHNVATGITTVADGFYKLNTSAYVDGDSNFTPDIKFYEFINGSINYDRFGTIGSTSSDGTVMFADENPLDNTINPVSATYTLPATVLLNDEFVARAITLTHVGDSNASSTYYIDTLGFLRRWVDQQIETSLNGIYKAQSNMFYFILPSGKATKYSGLTFGAVSYTHLRAHETG